MKSGVSLTLTLNYAECRTSLPRQEFLTSKSSSFPDLTCAATLRPHLWSVVIAGYPRYRVRPRLDCKLTTPPPRFLQTGMVDFSSGGAELVAVLRVPPETTLRMVLVEVGRLADSHGELRRHPELLPDLCCDVAALVAASGRSTS